MRLTVFGGCGAWPAAGQACGGYLLERDGFRLLVDPGYAVLPRLLATIDAAAVDAVVVSHGHPDHCADLSPLLRARALSDEPPAPLPVYAPAGAVDAVLALDSIRSVAGAVELATLTDGDGVRVGPFDVATASLPHFVPNLGMRITDGSATLTYSGDAGPDPALVELARDADLLLVEATYPDAVPHEDAGLLCSAVEAAEQGVAAGARRIMLTHLWPGLQPAAFLAAAARTGARDVTVAAPGPAQPIGS
ncbi:MBL fold metallo-hydrolase [Jiangella alkaliphila]|uniref:Ribonuclease BN, tRNA processing enzyme n=1 Tax=Jiangella alkaliphila TaxID=419479 RepID=A0A1H2K0L2_9ACTN|nr:MBL fold metallo-hydrolase [Jiangella alkaliphila]SDU62247.1 Ribonuclease BN, tRNA processing enzyme [Jiangella alkaliphila]